MKIATAITRIGLLAVTAVLFYGFSAGEFSAEATGSDSGSAIMP